MRRIDLDRPLESRKHYTLHKGQCQLAGKRYRYVDIYYDECMVATVFETPATDGTYRIRLYAADLGRFRLAHCWNLIFRKMNVDALVTKADVHGFGYNTEGFHVAHGEDLDKVSFDRVWTPCYPGEMYGFHTTRDKHIRGNKECMCSKCLERDVECQDNSSSNTKGLTRKSGRNSKSFPNLSTTLPTHIFKR